MSRGTMEALEELHARLDVHFRELHVSRQQLTPAAPVFALEHGLDGEVLEVLKGKVRSAVRQGFKAPARRWWLPFVVYAAELGYEYSGGEYWPTFEERTPYWQENGDRDRIRIFFEKFADEYGGARPQGRFAYFTIIAWPITNAVLPVHLQRNLAHLLYDFRTGLTAQLLQDPGSLGECLAARTGSYTEQFRYFCQNTALVGQVSVALLSGEEDESPYLLRSTLHRLVEGLSHERESQLWLNTARRAAGQVRSSTHGFVPAPRRPERPSQSGRLPRPTDPRLVLRRSPDSWRAYAELPDLSPLITRLPDMSEELRSRRSSVAGADRAYLPRGQLLYPGHEVRLLRWPQSGEPFISLERAPAPVNRLMGEQCAISGGPTWLFGVRSSGLAVEVKGKTMHPGSSYVLVTDEKADIPALPAATETTIEADGVRAFSITVPDTVNDSYAAAFAKADLSLVANVAIRPVGVVASMWDGEGSVEWLAGEPGMIGIYAEQVPGSCVVTVDGQSQSLPWPTGKRELLLRLDDLRVGTSEVSVSLVADSSKVIAEGSLFVTIRDPQIRPDGATAGEGIRLLADPAQPTLSDLWDGRAVVSIIGPSSRPATLSVTLLSNEGEGLAEIRQEVTLPVTPGNWSRIAAGIRSDPRFKDHYDDTQSTRVMVSQSGIGFASLTGERGFQPLRWLVTRRHDRSYVARLIDRTDGAQAKVELFKVSEPLVPVPCSPSADIAVPAQGGLLRATAGDVTAALLLPTQPNEVMRLRLAAPTVRGSSRTVAEVTRLAAAHLSWATAERPADPFASRQRDLVLDAISREIACLVGRSSHWSSAEHKMAHARDPSDCVDTMKACVGDAPSHRRLADRIAGRLHGWSTPEALLRGFADVLDDTMREQSTQGSFRNHLESFIQAPAGTEPGDGESESRAAARFLLALASQPGQIISDWPPHVREALLTKVLAAPVLLRAARFAVLGANAFRGTTTAGGTR